MKRGEQYPDLELTIDAVGKKASENISFYFSIKTCLITCQSIINSNVFPAISGYLHTIELSATEGYISSRHNRLRILYL